MTGSPDVIVVGGGCMGAATLHALTAAGVDNALLLERAAAAAGATGGSGGLVRAYVRDGESARLATDGLLAYRSFPEAVGESCGFEEAGHLCMLRGEDVTTAAARVEALRGAGLDAELLPADAAARRFPDVCWDGVAAAVHEPYAGYASPTMATRGWLTASARAGARTEEGVGAQRLVARRGRLSAVETSDGRRIACGAVVVAAGAWSRRLVGDAGVALPHRTKLIQADEFAVEGLDTLPAFADATTSTYGRPAGDGRLLLGLAGDRWDVDPHVAAEPDPRHAERARSAAAARLPALEHARRRRGQVRCDAYSDDGRGVVERSRSVRGLVVASGFSGSGFKMAPAIGARAATLAREALDDRGERGEAA